MLDVFSPGARPVRIYVSGGENGDVFSDIMRPP
jgi:hypothetical protein